MASEVKKMRPMTDEEIDQLEKMHKSSSEGLSDEEIDALESQDSGEKYNNLLSAAASAADAATMGYGPNIKAAIIDPLIDEKDRSYVERRDENNRVLQEMKQEDPISSGVGTGVGILGTALIPGGAAAEGATMAAKLGRAAVTSAGLGALADTQDVENQITLPTDIEDLKQRGIQAGAGLVVGGLAEGVGQAIRAVRPDKVEQGFKSFGPYKAQSAAARVAGEEGKLATKTNLVDFARNNGILKPWSSINDLYDRSFRVMNQYGKHLDNLYQSAQNKLTDMEHSGMNPLNISRSLNREGIQDLKDSIVKELRGTFRFSVDRDNAIGNVSKYFDDIASKEQPSILDLHEIKSQIGKEAEFVKANPQLSSQEKMWKVAYKRVDDAINKRVDELAEFSGNKELGQELRNANRNYSLSRRIKDIVSNRLDSQDAEYSPTIAEFLTNLSVTPRARSTLSSVGAGIEKVPTIDLARGVVPNVVPQVGQQMAPAENRMIEGFPIMMTKPVDDFTASKYDMEIRKSNLPPSEKAKRLNLVRKHKSIYIGD